MMWNANYAGPSMYSFTTYAKTPLMLSMLGGIVGDDNVQRAMSDYAKAWAFKHPSPWDYIFFMNNALKQDLNWFWYYWLWTTESVDGSIEQRHDRRHANDRDRAAGRPDAVAGGAARAVRGDGPRDQADAEREDRRQLRARHVAGGRVVQRQPHVRRRARLRRPRDHERSSSIPACRFPDRDAERQRLAAARGRRRATARHLRGVKLNARCLERYLRN